MSFVAALFLACFGGRGPDEVPEPTLADVTFEVTHQSVARLGPHRHTSVIEREEVSGDGAPTRTEETVEVLWGGWDDFAMRRLRGGFEVSSRMVVDGTAWVRKKGKGWESQRDAEPLRVRYRTTWDTWDEAMELFVDRVQLEPGVEGVMEGRPVQHYAVMLAPPPSHVGAARREKQGGATHLEGVIVVDKATGVRLRADVHGTHQRGARVRRVGFTEVRTGFGEAPDLETLLKN